jgi:Xaa-Pro dipeptidase
MDISFKLQKAQTLMQQSALDALIVYSNGTSHILRPAYYHFMSGIHPLGPNNAVIISKEGKAVLLVEPKWDSARASEKSCIPDVKGSMDFIGDLVRTLRELNVRGVIGIAGINEMPEPVYSAISEIATVKSADDLIEEMAKGKDDTRIRNVRKAARIADAGFKALFANTRPGIREYELAAEAGYAMRAAGADDIFMFISTEPHNYALHGPTIKRLASGDIVIVEMAPFCDGQCVQICRSIMLGEASKILLDKYQLLVHAFEESLKQLKPGLPASLMSRAMNKIISDAGYAEYCRPPHMRARGHGFGTGSIAPGALIDNDTSVLLEPYQVLVPHPNQYFPEIGYLACGETVMINETGIERLFETENRLYIKGL